MARTAPSPLVLAPLAVGTVAIAAGRLWSGALLVFLGLVRVHLILWPQLDSLVDRKVSSGIGRAVGAVAGLLLAVGAAVIIAPAGLAARLLHLDVLDRGGAASWRSPSPTSAPARTFSLSTPARPTPSPRRAVRLACMVLAASAVTAAIQHDGRLAVTSAPAGGSRNAAALRDQSDVTAMQQEEAAVFQALEPDPLLGWALPARIDGTVVSVRSGTRLTTSSSRRGPSIWLFGGSTAWGSGQRDPHTIASQLARLAGADGRPVEVVNWGVFAYASFQESRAFARAVEVRGAPDIVVFYDGYNDVEVGMSAQLQGSGQGSQVMAPLDVLEREPVLYRSPLAPASTTEQRVDGIISSYRRAMADARTVADANGVEMVQVWHPNAFTRQPTPAERADLERLGFSTFLRGAHASLHEQVRAGLPPEVIDLADSLDGAPTVYVDQVHTNEEGARIVAEALYRALRPALTRVS